jgi:hypothetical protein
MNQPELLQKNEQKPHATFDWLWILWAFLWTLAAIAWAVNSPDGLSFQSFVAGFLGLAALKYLIRFEP